MTRVERRLEEARRRTAAALEELMVANNHQLDEVCRSLRAMALMAPAHRKRLRRWLAQVGTAEAELSAAKRDVRQALRDVAARPRPPVARE